MFSRTFSELVISTVLLTPLTASGMFKLIGTSDRTVILCDEVRNSLAVTVNW
jgi:hypothetical protein